MEVSVQFRTLIDKLFKTQQNAADRLGFKKAFINSIATGNARISGNVILQIAEKYPQVNIDWLIHGRGPMFWKLGSDNTILNMVEESDPEYNIPGTGGDVSVEKVMLELQALQEKVRRLSKEKI